MEVQRRSGQRDDNAGVVSEIGHPLVAQHVLDESADLLDFVLVWLDGIYAVPCVGADVGAGKDDVSSAGGEAGQGFAKRGGEDLIAVRNGPASDFGGHLLAADEVDGQVRRRIHPLESGTAGRRNRITSLHDGPAMKGGEVKGVAGDDPAGLVGKGPAESGIVVIGPHLGPVEFVDLPDKMDFREIRNAAVNVVHEPAIRRGVKPGRR